MARLFRSKSVTLDTRHSVPPITFLPNSRHSQPCQDEMVEEEEEEEEEEDNDDQGYFGDFFDDSDNPAATTPFISPAQKIRMNQPQFSMLAVVAAALRRSLVTCSVEADDVASEVDIGWPTDVRHVSHVTFDRFNGFLGLPVELQPDVPRKPPSASARVFGVSAQSMQCSHDNRGNSVPTILLKIQSRLYTEGGLQAEGIFRINAENGQEELVRNQLNKGFVPHGIDVHCLAGLIKAWFRELPSGVLDALTPEQVMHCNTEEECSQLVNLLPPTEAALLDWAINLMVDVVQHEHQNKMNARNIAMVFAPNMTKMADPLTALIHAVQVMNFLKTLILKTLHKREESDSTSLFTECSDNSLEKLLEDGSYTTDAAQLVLHKQALNDCFPNREEAEAEAAVTVAKSDQLILRSWSLERRESAENKNSLSSRSKSDVGEKYDRLRLGRPADSPGLLHKRRTLLDHSFNDSTEAGEGEVGIVHRLSLRKLRWHPVFQLSKTIKMKKGRGSLPL